MNIPVERLNNGKPIIAPQGDGWESQGTANSCALLLERRPSIDRVLEPILGSSAMKDSRLRDGVVVSLYTGCGIFAGDTVGTQSRGLAIFTPAMELVKRLAQPVFRPSMESGKIDAFGIEDARLTLVGDTFHIWYCGYDGKDGAACVAHSRDLLNWHRVAPLPGNINDTYNKDHVIIERKIAGKWWMFHRPWGPKFPDMSDMVIRLASADDLLGPWTDCGEIIRGFQHPGRKTMWVGAGPAPMPLGGDKFLLLYHTGSYFPNGHRQYDACAAMLDFSRFAPEHPGAIVTRRLEPIMTPETEWEKNPKLKLDIVFPMGAYRHGKYLMMVYGAGDVYTCAARMPFDALVEAVERSDLHNPYL